MTIKLQKMSEESLQSFLRAEEAAKIPEFRNIFINNINWYRGNALLKRLLQSDMIRVSGFIYGTVYGNVIDHQPIDCHPAIILDRRSDSFLETVSSCDVIIYDIGWDNSQVEEAQKVLNALDEYYRKENLDNSLRYFILVSTPLTWTNTVSSEEEEGAPVFKEAEYRTRRANDCYQSHKKLERDVLIAQKRHQPFLKSIVICPGATYGGSNDFFRYICKKAFYNTEPIKIFEPGSQRLPFLYINDFARIIEKILRDFPNQKIRYIFAAQPEHLSLMRFARIIVRGIAGDPVRIIISNNSSVTESDPELITPETQHYLNLNMILRTSFLSNFDYTIFPGDEDMEILIANEFSASLNITPLKILIDGPPCVGKTHMAKALADYYKLHYISHSKADDILALGIEHRLNAIESYLDQIDKNKDDVSEAYLEIYDSQRVLITEEMNSMKEVWQTELQKIESQKCDSNDEEREDLIKRCLINVLSWKSCCQNQGYVLDGFPYTYDEAAGIFPQELFDQPNPFSIKPTHLIIIEGEDDVLVKRAISLPEEVAIETENTEEKFFKRLQDYRFRTEDDVSIISFFTDNDLVPIILKVSDSISFEKILEQATTIIGLPRTYPVTKREALEIANKELKKREAKELEEKQSLENFEMRARSEREKKLRQWTVRLEQLKKEEQEANEARFLPLRHYLMKYILPTLMDGLLEVANIRPANPVEYISEFLFRHTRYRNTMESSHSDDLKKLLKEEVDKALLSQKDTLSCQTIQSGNLADRSSSSSFPTNIV